jgi:glycosyltransferase involved in cell wall biosynthesis
MPETKRIALLVNEILGLVRTGGAGTANTFLSFALARLGHNVEILFTDASVSVELDPTWAREYAARGIAVHRLVVAGNVVPGSLAVPHAVDERLRQGPPEVVIAGDWGAPAYAALRLREVGLDYGETLFVVYCHGSTPWVADAHGKARRSLDSFEREVLERASVELADAVVSPSAYMLDWMASRGWQLPASFVAPYFTRGPADRTSNVPPTRDADPVRRLVFFGRLEPRKGIEPFLQAVNLLDANMLDGIELVFLGRDTPEWPAARVRGRLSNRDGVRFLTELDQPAALAFLREPGSLAVMPSLVDNSPNVVYECMELGIPFIASSEGGGPELVAEQDRARTFVEPTAQALRNALARALEQGVAPTRPAFEPERSLALWKEVLTIAPRIREPAEQHEDFALLSDDADELDPDCLQTLQRAQTVSGADVITCGVRIARGRREKLHLFLGEPSGLGAIANYYGTVALCRRALFPGGDDPAWVRLARLALSGARIVSVPRPLARTTRAPGSAASDPEAALAVVRAFERAQPPTLRALPRLAAGLAALAAQGDRPPTPRERLAWVWTHEGAGGLLRRGRLRAGRLAGSIRARIPRAQQAERGQTPGADGSHERNGQKNDGRDKGEQEFAGVAGGPGGLPERLVGEGDEPQQR